MSCRNRIMNDPNVQMYPRSCPECGFGPCSEGVKYSPESPLEEKYFYSVDAQNKKVFLDWKSIDRDANYLARELKETGIKFDVIVAVARGGFVPAAIIAHQLGIKEVIAVRVHGYNDTEDLGDRILGFQDINTLKMIDSKRTLIIDDLADSGKTLDLIRNYAKNSTIATLYAKPSGTESTDYFGRLFGSEDWIVFPWEL